MEQTEEQKKAMQLFFLKAAQTYNRKKNAKRKERKLERQNKKKGRR